jgi:hypothetical protein
MLGPFVAIAVVAVSLSVSALSLRSVFLLLFFPVLGTE